MLRPPLSKQILNSEYKLTLKHSNGLPSQATALTNKIISKYNYGKISQKRNKVENPIYNMSKTVSLYL